MKRLPKEILDLFPLWEYQCSKCGTYTEPNVLHCPHCLNPFDEMKWRVPPRFLKDEKAMSRYAHEILAPKLGEKQRERLFQYFTEYFNNGFEEGNFSAWTGIEGNVLPTVQSSTKHHGIYAGQAVIPAGGAVSSYIKKVFGSSYSTLFHRLYIHFTNTPANGVSMYLSSIYCNSTAESLILFGIYNDAETLKWFLWYRTDDNIHGTEYSTTPTINTSQWYCIEMKIVEGTGNGEARLWIDGTERCAKTGLTNDDNPVDSVRPLHYYANPTPAVTVTVDCVVAADAYIGVEAGTVLREVTDTLSLSDTVLSNKTFAISDSVGLMDSFGLGDKTLMVTDSVNLTELITVITGEIIKYLTDTIGLSDEVKVNKAFIISETVGLLDQIFRHKTAITVADAIALAEVAAVTKLMLVTDQVALTDIATIMKQLNVSDTITLADSTAIPQRILQVLDQISLSEHTYVDKALQITDMMSLAEVVEVGTGGIKKTRLFLIIGDLAVQLTGD